LPRALEISALAQGHSFGLWSEKVFPLYRRARKGRKHSVTPLEDLSPRHIFADLAAVLRISGFAAVPVAAALHRRVCSPIEWGPGT
jgi:hypothetical protein